MPRVIEFLFLNLPTTFLPSRFPLKNQKTLICITKTKTCRSITSGSLSVRSCKVSAFLDFEHIFSHKWKRNGNTFSSFKTIPFPLSASTGSNVFLNVEKKKIKVYVDISDSLSQKIKLQMCMLSLIYLKKWIQRATVNFFYLRPCFPTMLYFRQLRQKQNRW